MNKNKNPKELLVEIGKLKQALSKAAKLEKILQATNQQLEATEQQLRANNQQMELSRKVLETEKEFSESLLETANSFIVLLDIKGNISLFNQFAEKITGYKKEEVLGKNWFSLFIPQRLREDIPTVFHNVLLGMPEFSTHENAILCKNSTERWFSWKNNVLKADGQKISGILSIGNDVTERKRTEQIQKVLYNISNAVTTTNNLEQLIGQIQKELSPVIDTTNFYVGLYDKQTGTFSLPFLADEFDNISSFPARNTLSEYVVKTRKSLLARASLQKSLAKKGVIKLLGTPSKTWLGVPLHVAGKVTGVLAVQSYTNEAAYNEEDLKLLEFVSDQISTSIHRKKYEEDLEAALEKAQESDRLKSAFLANMSHEIRTPMNGILGFTNLLNSSNIDESERQKYTAIINKSGERLLNTVNDLIDISKIEAGQVKVVNTKTSLNLLFAEIHDFFALEANTKGLTISSLPTPDDEEVIVITDQDKLHRILTNLVKNAIKFTPKGSITFGYLLKGNFLEFFVKDTGIGIPRNRQQAVFNRFEQADVGTGYSRSFEGSGLGLAISKAYVEMLGGKIWITSEEGKGTTFRFTLPYKPVKIAEGNITAERKQISREEAVKKGLNLLIVEDEEMSTFYLESILKDKFEKILYATNGREAIEIYKNNPDIDLILMDMLMPEMDGYEATRQIRKLNNKVVIIAQTAFALAGDREKALEAGCNDYIAKPIEKEQLLKMISTLVRN